MFPFPEEKLSAVAAWHGHTACHVERAPLPTAHSLSDTPQLLWLWAGRAILILHSLGVVDAHSYSQLFSGVLIFFNFF